MTFWQSVVYQYSPLYQQTEQPVIMTIAVGVHLLSFTVHQLMTDDRFVSTHAQQMIDQSI